MATVDIFQICKKKCGFYHLHCCWWYQPPIWWHPMWAHLGRWANLNTSYICNLRSLWCIGWEDHFRICSFHIFQKPILNILALKFATIAVKICVKWMICNRWGWDGPAADGEGLLGTAQVEIHQTKPNQTKPNQTKPNQTKNKPKYPEPNQTNASQTKPNQAETKPILKFAGVLISPRWVVTAG